MAFKALSGLSLPSKVRSVTIRQLDAYDLLLKTC